MQKNTVWHPYTPGMGGDEIRIVKGQGSWLFTSDGRKILDAIGSWWVNVHGHAHPRIAQAIADQAHTLEQVIFAGFTHNPAEDLAATILPQLPGEMAHAFYTDNGSTAVEVALKMALQHFHIKGEKRTKILALENAYHGDTFGAMAVGARGPFSAAFQDWLIEVNFIDPPYNQHIDSEGPSTFDSLDRVKKWCEQGDVAAIIVEPLLQGAGGMLIFEKNWLNQLFILAKKFGVLIIADEVFTGFFKTGKPFATHYIPSPPDIICLSKGLTGGFLPLGLTACNELVAEPFQPKNYQHTLYHGHSFTANPLACAAGIASWALTQESGFSDALTMICQKQADFSAKIRSLFPDYKARNLGTVFALTLEEKDGIQYTHPIRGLIYQHFIGKGILLRPVGNVLYFVPPFSTTAQEIDWVHGEIFAFLNGLG